MSKYDKLDNALLHDIKDGRNKYFMLSNRVRTLAEQIAGKHMWRTIGRRLQSLRKSGVIRFEGGRWVMVKCRCGGDGAPDHTCPYAQEIGKDSETLCNCCDTCTQQCARDI